MDMTTTERERFAICAKIARLIGDGQRHSKQMEEDDDAVSRFLDKQVVRLCTVLIRSYRDELRVLDARSSLFGFESCPKKRV